ncbi:MAG: dihydroorotase family protein [Candidatus Bathyarchaeia archaeon]
MPIILIENARILRAGKLARANILVSGEKIKSVTETRKPPADERIDAKGRFVMPGLVDGHAHLHDPAFTNREDFTSGTSAAAAGGVTSVVEMVLSTPVDSADRVRAKIEEGRRHSLIDFSLHAGMMNLNNLPNIPEIAELGVRSFKTFTCKPYYADDHTLMSLMRETSMHHSILNVHAEDEQIANDNLQKLLAEGRREPLAHAEWKPNVVEERAVNKVIEFARGIGARLHISHMSTHEGVAAVKKAKREGVRVTTETCPHYLTFTRRDMKKQGPYLKMNPSLKGPKDVEALWKGLRDGTIDIVTSEHAPGVREEKEVGWADIWKAWGGVPAIETMLPVLLSEGINKHRLTLSALQRVCCENPARIFGNYPRKGAIIVGADADLVMIDLKMKRKVRGEGLHQKVDWTPYEGWTLKGWPILTMRRGQIIYQDQQIVGTPGSAEFLPMAL